MEKQKVTLRDTVKGLKMTINYLFSKWKIIVLAGLLGGALGFFYAYIQHVKYKAVLTFALEEKGGGIGNYANIASQLGLDVGASSSGGAFVGENLLELLKSRMLLRKTLLKDATIDGKNDLFINHYISLYEIDKVWKNNPEIDPITYSHLQKEEFSIRQDSLCNWITENILIPDLSVKKLDKKLNIVVVEFMSLNPLLSKLFVQNLVKNASEFYVETKTRKTKSNVALLELRIDSVKQELTRIMYGSAVNQDRNINTVKAEGRVSLSKNQLDIQLLSTMYAELTKNLELSKFTLMREEPLIQIIDNPILPLPKVKTSKLKSLVLGGMMFGLVAVIYVLLRRTYFKLISIDSDSDQIIVSP